MSVFGLLQAGASRGYLCAGGGDDFRRSGSAPASNMGENPIIVSLSGRPGAADQRQFGIIVSKIRVVRRMICVKKKEPPTKIFPNDPF
jgi:hypothetical protein